MIYLSGGTPKRCSRQAGLGIMLTPNMRHGFDLSGAVWAGDTGCYSQGAAFDLCRYLTWLDGLRGYQDTCLFATAPDVVGDAPATWQRSRDVLPQLRAMGYRAALVAQDGLEDMAVPWTAFDCLFVGGTTAWKLSEAAWELAAEAKRRGKWVHLGRVNSARRLRAAALAGYDSADGTYIAFGPDRNLPRVLAWLQAIEAQPVLLTQEGGR